MRCSFRKSHLWFNCLLPFFLGSYGGLSRLHMQVDASPLLLPLSCIQQSGMLGIIAFILSFSLLPNLSPASVPPSPLALRS